MYSLILLLSDCLSVKGGAFCRQMFTRLMEKEGALNRGRKGKALFNVSVHPCQDVWVMTVSMVTKRTANTLKRQTFCASTNISLSAVCCVFCPGADVACVHTLDAGAASCSSG